MPDIRGLRHDEVREALRLLGTDPPTQRATAQRALRDTLRGYGTVRSVLERAPDGARAAFVRLAQDGPARVEELLGRGWWGHGTLPPPLDWLQLRALVVVGDDALLHATTEARDGFADLVLDLGQRSAGPRSASCDLGQRSAGPRSASSDLGQRSAENEPEPLRIEPARCVVVATAASSLNAALAVGAARLRLVAPTVALSSRPPAAVEAALRAAGLPLADDVVVAADPREPALPGSVEDAVGPRAIRVLLDRAVAERRQVRLSYFASSRAGVATERIVDPWVFGDDLLRGYCHLRSGERTFAVDRIGRARLLASQIEHLRD